MSHQSSLAPGAYSFVICSANVRSIARCFSCCVLSYMKGTPACILLVSPRQVRTNAHQDFQIRFTLCPPTGGGEESGNWAASCSRPRALCRRKGGERPQAFPATTIVKMAFSWLGTCSVAVNLWLFPRVTEKTSLNNG